MLSWSGGRLEPLQHRLVTLAIRQGVVFGAGTREGGPAKTTLLHVLHPYMYRRSRRSTLYVQRCTIDSPSSWQDARRKTPNDLFSLPLVPSRALRLSLSSFVLFYLLSILFHRGCLLRRSTFRLFYSSSSPSALFRAPALFPARCSETLRLLAGGLASYAGCASCAETAANLRQFVFGIAS